MCRVPSAAGVILCPASPEISASMDGMYFSPTRNPETSHARGYEISSLSLWVSNDISLQGSCTTTGDLTFTLMRDGTLGSAYRTPLVSTWTDTILTYRSQEAPKPWQNIARNMTVRSFVTSQLQSLSPVVETPDGETYCEIVPMQRLFWEELKNTIQEICAYLWDDFLSFASGGSEVNDPSILDDVANSFWNQMNFESGHDFP